jgi:hypothetical protein
MSGLHVSSSRRANATVAYAVLVGTVLLAAVACTHKAVSGSALPGPVRTPVVSANAAAAPDNDSIGTVNATLRGSIGRDHVACTAIDTELLISANEGRIRWTAIASDRTVGSYPFVGAALPGVVLDPPSGVLEPGQSQVLHVSGRHTGSTFYIAVIAPNASGYSESTIPLYCVSRS